MKPHQIIGNYCQLYGVTVPEIDYSETQFFVAVSHECAKVMHWRGPSALLGRIVCEAMKRGVVIYVHNGWVKLLTWENWKQTWAKLFVPKKRDTQPEPNTVLPYRSEIFEQGQQERPRKKPQKHGFRRTFNANFAMNLYGPTRGIRTEVLGQGGLIYTARYTRLAEGFPAGVAWQTIGASVRCAFFITTINHLRP